MESLLAIGIPYLLFGLIANGVYRRKNNNKRPDSLVVGLFTLYFIIAYLFLFTAFMVEDHGRYDLLSLTIAGAVIFAWAAIRLNSYLFGAENENVISPPDTGSFMEELSHSDTAMKRILALLMTFSIRLTPGDSELTLGDILQYVYEISEEEEKDKQYTQPYLTRSAMWLMEFNGLLDIDDCAGGFIRRLREVAELEGFEEEVIKQFNIFSKFLDSQIQNKKVII